MSAEPQAHPFSSRPDIVSCCAVAYESEWATMLLGDSLHPGGLQLTQRLGELLNLNHESRVLDVTAGRGTSAIYLAQTFGCHVTGIDASSANTVAAIARATEANLTDRTSFSCATAGRLPFRPSTFDAIICECAFCTFPDKSEAALEFARVLNPDGALALSDIVRRADLPSSLDTLLGWIACIGGAQSEANYAGILTEADLSMRTIEQHDESLREMAEQVRGRLLTADLMSKLGKIDLSTIDLEQAQQLVRDAISSITIGALGYAVLIADKSAGTASVTTVENTASDRSFTNT